MFAPGPRAVGFTIVWPEGVIFRSMMTYHVQFLLLVLAGWVNRQQQDVIDYLQEENRVLRAGLRGKRLRLSDDDRRRRSRPRLWAGRRWPRLRPLPHPLRFCAGTATSSQPSTMAARTGAQADLRRRRISVSSFGEWMKQAARNLTDMWDGFLLGKRYLIHDRDPLFTEAVRGLLRDSGVKPLRLPANSPNLNAYAERFVLSIRRECLDRFVPLSERHLRTAVTEYVVHYHTERNHQGLGNELLTPLPASANSAGPIVSRERLGGILNYYCRAA